MTMRVLFNGAVLIRPGGASRIDATAFQGAGLAGVGVVGLVGEAEGGEPNAIQIFSSPDAAKAVFRSGPLADAVGLAFSPMKDPRVPGGAASVVCVRVNQGTQSSLVVKKALTDVLVLKSKDYGSHTNRLSAAISVGGTGFIVEIKNVDGQTITRETSPVVGGTAEFSIRYVGTGNPAVMSINATHLTTTVNGASGDDLNLRLADFASVADLITYIDSHPAYTCVAVALNPYTIKPTDLDFVSNVDILTGAYSAYAQLYRIREWINNNSSLITASLPSPVVTQGSPTAFTETKFTGGTRGAASNTDFQDGLDLLKKVRINQVVSLISYDLADEGYGATAAFQPTAVNTEQHATYMTSTKGKSERHAFVGMRGSKTEVLAFATGSMNSYNACLVCQRPTVVDSQNNLVEMPEWALAVIAAGARAGSELGEPLTWKYLNIYGLSQDPSWNTADDGEDMILGGVMIVEQVPGRGFRWVKGITTYTKSDNDAYTEESVVQGWKTVAYEFRTHLEDLFIGRRMSISNISGVRQAAEAKLSAFRDAGQIVDSVVDGEVTRAYRKLRVTGTKDQVMVSAEISPVEGINFMLDSLYLVPATFSV